MAQFRERALIGTADAVAARVRALAEDHGVAEVAIVAWAHDETARRRSYALLAEAFGLPGGRP